MTHAEIEAFLAICEHENITKAAHSLYIGQASLSTRLKLLEEKVGCKLLTRGKGQRTVLLTPEGQQFYQLARQYRVIMSMMKGIGKKENTTRLRISSLNSHATYLFSQIYDYFMEELPGWDLEIQDMKTIEACESIFQNMTDMAFVAYLPTKKEDLMVRKVLSEEMVLICSADHEYGENVSITELPPEKEIFVDWSKEYGQWRELKLGKNVAPYIQVEIMSQLEFFLKKKGNWAIVPYSVACGVLADEKIKRCYLKEAVPPRVTYCLYKEGKEETLAVKEFFLCMRQVIENMESDQIRIEL